MGVTLMNEINLIKYVKRTEYLKAIIIKLVLSISAAFLFDKTLDNGLPNIFSMIFTLYFAFTIYHISLRLSGNYIIAFILCILFACLIVFVNDLHRAGKISDFWSDFFFLFIVIAPFLYDLYIFIYVLCMKIKSLKG